MANPVKLLPRQEGTARASGLITVRGHFGDYSLSGPEQASWTTSDANVVAFVANGVEDAGPLVEPGVRYVGKAIGTATLTATLGALTGQVTVEVVRPELLLIWEYSDTNEKTVLVTSRDFPLTCNGLAPGENIPVKADWSTSNAAVITFVVAGGENATVTAQKRVVARPKGVGVASITATLGGVVTAPLVVTVAAPASLVVTGRPVE